MPRISQRRAWKLTSWKNPSRLEIPHGEPYLAEGAFASLVELLDGASHHHLHDLFPGDLGDRFRADLLRVPHNRHAVRDPEDLGQVVRDVYDGNALLLEALDDGEQPVHFLAGEGAGGLVHHEDGRVVAQDLGDLHELGLVLADVLYGKVGIQVETDMLEELPCLLPRPRLVQERPPARETARQEVLRDADGARQAQLLVDHADAALLGSRGRVQRLHASVHGYRAGVVVE